MYGEIFRVLKPSGLFGSYEWVSTKDYDPKNPEHVRIMDEINFGNGLPVSGGRNGVCAFYLSILVVVGGRGRCNLRVAWQGLRKLPSPSPAFVLQRAPAFFSKLQ